MLVRCEVHLLGDWGERAMRWYVYKRFKSWQTWFFLNIWAGVQIISPAGPRDAGGSQVEATRLRARAAGHDGAVHRARHRPRAHQLRRYLGTFVAER